MLYDETPEDRIRRIFQRQDDERVTRLRQLLARVSPQRILSSLAQRPKPKLTPTVAPVPIELDPVIMEQGRRKAMGPMPIAPAPIGGGGGLFAVARDEARKRGLGFLFEAPKLGLHPKEIAGVAAEELSKIPRGGKELIGDIRRPFISGHPLKAAGTISSAGGRFIGRELYQTVFRPGLAAAGALGAVGGNVAVGSRNLMDIIATGSVQPATSAEDAKFQRELLYDPETQMKLGLTSGLVLPPLETIPASQALPSASRLALNLTYPGGQLEAAGGLLKGAGRLTRWAVTSAGRQSVFNAGRALEKVAPSVGQTLQKPHYNRIESLAHLPRYTYEQPDGPVTGLLLDQGNLYNLISDRRMTKTRNHVMNEGGDIALKKWDADTADLEVFKHVLADLQWPQIVIKEGNLHTIAGTVAQLAQSRAVALSEEARTLALEQAVAKMESLLGYVKEGDSAIGGYARPLFAVLKRNLARVGVKDPEFAARLTALNKRQTDLKELNEQIIPGGRKAADRLRTTGEQTLIAVKEQLPAEAHAAYDNYVYALTTGKRSIARAESLLKKELGAQAGLFDSAVTPARAAWTDLNTQYKAVVTDLATAATHRKGLIAEMVQEGKSIRPGFQAAHEDVVKGARSYLFRPANVEEMTAPFYALERLAWQGNAKSPLGYTTVAVLKPVSPETASSGGRALRAAYAVQETEKLTAMEAELAVKAQAVEAARIAANKAERAGAGVEEALTAVDVAKQERIAILDKVKTLRGEVETARGQTELTTEAIAVLQREGSLVVDLADLDRTFVPYRLAAKGPSELGGTTGSAYLTRLRLERQSVEEDLRKLTSRRDALEGDLDSRRAIRDGGPTVARDDKIRAAAESQIFQKEYDAVIRRHDSLSRVLDRINVNLDTNLRATNQDRFVQSYRLRKELEFQQQKRDQAMQRAADYGQELANSSLPLPVQTIERGGEKIAVVPEYMNKETLAGREAAMSGFLLRRHLEAITETYGPTSGRIASKAELNESAQLFESMYAPLRNLAFQKGLAQPTRQLEELAPTLSANAGFQRINAAWETWTDAVDRAAFRGGIPGFLKRHGLGTGYRTPEFEAAANTRFNMEDTAAFHVKAYFGRLYQLAGETATAVARSDAAKGAPKAVAALAEARKATTVGGKLPAWLAHNLVNMDDHERVLSETLRRFARPMDHPAWQVVWNEAETAMGQPLPPEVKQMVWRRVAGEFPLAALYGGKEGGNLFRHSDIPLALRQQLEAYRKNTLQLEDVGHKVYRLNWSRSQTVKYEFRQTYGPNGRLFKPNAADLAEGDRTVKNPLDSILGDYIETAMKIYVGQQQEKSRRFWLLTHEGIPSFIRGHSAEGTRGMPMTLDQIYLDPASMTEALPAIVLKRMNENEFTRKLSSLLGSQADKSKLREQGGSLQGTLDWRRAGGETRTAAENQKISAAMGADWEKLQGLLHRDDPKGVWAVMDAARRAFNTIPMSILIGDASIMGIQTAFLFAINPVAAARAAGMMIGRGGNIWSDSKFSVYTAANADLLETAVSRGLGLGMEAYVGARFRSASMWEHIPLLMPFGKAARYVNDVHFNRYMMVLKTEAIKSHLETIHALKMVGPAIAQPFINGIPGLNRLNKEVDLLNATPMESFDAVIRLVNNQFGGVPRSQNQLGLWREFAERSLLIVPGFFRARAGLISQVSRSVRDPSSIEGWLAMRIIGREIFTTQLVAGGIAAMTGNGHRFLADRDSPDKWSKAAVWGIPFGEDGEFLKIAPAAGAMQLYAGLAVAGANLDPKALMEVVSRTARGRQNPALSLIADQIAQKDYWGNNRTSVKDHTIMAIQSVLPVWMSEMSTTIEDQVYQQGTVDPKAVAVDTAAEFLGLSHRPPDPYKDLNNRFRAWQERKDPKTDPMDWQDATGDLKDMARQGDPAIGQAEGVWFKDHARKATDREEFANGLFNQSKLQQDHLDAVQQADTRDALNGKLGFDKWATRHKDIQQSRAMDAEELRKNLILVGLDLKERGSEKLAQMQIDGKGPIVALALAEYKAVQIQPKKDARKIVMGDGTVIPDTNELDFKTFQAERDQVLSRYPQSVQDEVRALVAPKDPLEIRYKSAQDDLDAYFENIPKYRQLSAPDGNYIDFIISSMRSVEKRVRQENITVPRRQIYLLALRKLVQGNKITTQRQVKLASAAYAFALDNEKRTMARNPLNLRFITQHPDLLRFFPWFRGEVPTGMWQYLPEDTRAQVDIESLQQRELRDTPLTAIG